MLFTLSGVAGGSDPARTSSGDGLTPCCCFEPLPCLNLPVLPLRLAFLLAPPPDAPPSSPTAPALSSWCDAFLPDLLSGLLPKLTIRSPFSVWMGGQQKEAHGLDTSPTPFSTRVLQQPPNVSPTRTNTNTIAGPLHVRHHPSHAWPGVISN